MYACMVVFVTYRDVVAVQAMLELTSLYKSCFKAGSSERVARVEALSAPLFRHIMDYCYFVTGGREGVVLTLGGVMKCTVCCIQSAC